MRPRMKRQDFTDPVVREQQIQLIGAPKPQDYVVEITTVGVRFRRKGERVWLGPASWDSVLTSACRVTTRENARAANEELHERGRKRA